MLKLNRKTKWDIGICGAVFLMLFSVALILILPKPILFFLKPTYLPQGIVINDAYTNIDDDAGLGSVVSSAAYTTTNPSMSVYAYRSDDGSVLQLDCSQQVQDQTCTRKVTQKGITYFVFNSLNSTLQTHSVRVKATINSNVIEIDVEPPLTTELNETYDWSRTLDSLTTTPTSSLTVHHVHYGG